MLAILKNRTYRHLFRAQVIALIGTGLVTVALGLLTFELAETDAGAVLGDGARHQDGRPCPAGLPSNPAKRWRHQSVESDT